MMCSVMLSTSKMEALSTFAGLATMNLLTALLLADLFSNAFFYDNCLGNLCTPKWRKFEAAHEDLDRRSSVFLGRDEESGCECRVVPEKHSFCYGSATCRSFPRRIKITTKSFQLRGTRIGELKRGDLISLTHLEVLTVEGNFNLTKILNGTFVEMSKLRYLSISFNDNLRSLEEGCFEGLLNLVELCLVKNAFSQLAPLILPLRKIPKLQKLDLSKNSFTKIGKNDFEPLRGSNLTELKLILCQIEVIEPQVFNPLTNLTSLKLGENTFNEIEIAKTIEEAVRHVPLRLLNLYSIGLTKNSSKLLLKAVANSNITDLNLAHNQFEVITGETFPQMPNLKILDLKAVSILNISSDAFISLTNLKTLLLSGNKLSSLPERVLLKHVSYLDLQQNSGDSFSSSYFSIYGEKFVNMKNLEHLVLSFNAIHVIHNTSFEGLSQLKVLGLKNATIYRIENGSFANLTNLIVLNLENNPFAKTHPEALTKNLFRGLENLQVLLLGGCDIGHIDKTTFQELKNLHHLGLEKNKLVTLPSFEALPLLKTLDVSQNSLQPWSERIFEKNRYLKDFRANDNKFPFLTEEMVEDFKKLRKLELKNNPFICDCSFSWNSKPIMTLIENESIFCAFPETTRSLTIQEFIHQNRNCQHLALVLSLVFLLLVLAAFVFVLYYFRWHLRYWMFLARLHLSRNGQSKRNIEENAYTNYIYDAFVSYSNEDSNFVIRLVTMLENYPPFIKLCVYERDFEIGTMISENILESLAKSRKTVLIISDSYAKSQWCRWESQIAEHHRLFFQTQNGDDSLILLKLGPVSESHLTPTLKYLLKTRIYLQWDPEEKKQKAFWEKLRTALAPPKEINENTYL